MSGDGRQVIHRIRISRESAVERETRRAAAFDAARDEFPGAEVDEPTYYGGELYVAVREKDARFARVYRYHEGG